MRRAPRSHPRIIFLVSDDERKHLVPHMGGILYSTERLLDHNPGSFMARYLFVALSVAAFFATTPLWAAQKLDAKEMAFLQKAAQGQLAEIALGKLALKKASHKEVKEFGAEIIEDHQYASQELNELSAEEGIYLPAQLDDKHKAQQQRLSHLSGKEFDGAFIACLLNNHRKVLKEFEKNAAMSQNAKVRHWAEATLPILTVHLKKAERVSDVLGLDHAK